MKEYIENQMDYIQRNVMTDDRNTVRNISFIKVKLVKTHCQQWKVGVRCRYSGILQMWLAINVFNNNPTCKTVLRQ